MKETKWMRLLRCAVCALLLAALADATVYALACDTLPQQVLRLHVVANSDSETDQSLKLLVRDAVLKEAAGLWETEAAEDAFSMQSALCERLNRLQSAAEAALRRAGSDQPVRLFFVDMPFPRCVYGGFVLPAGSYRALRVVLGEGRGHNWWCVLFPSLCLPAAAAPAEEALSPAQQAVTRGDGQVRVRFKLGEWLRGLERLFAAQ